MDFSPIRLIERAVLFEGLVEQFCVHLIVAQAVRSSFIVPSTDLCPNCQLAQRVNQSTVVGIRLVKVSLIFT